MAATIIYLIKWAILLALGVALFMLLMRGETFHRFNRWLLLAIASFSMVLPAVNFSIDSPMARFSSVIEQLVVGDAVVNSEVSIMIEEPLAQMLVADNVSEDIKKAVDINEDGSVNVADISAIKSNFSSIPAVNL